MQLNLVHGGVLASLKSIGIAMRCGTSALMAFVTIAAMASTEQFKPVQTYTVGLDPRFVAVGDFNRDGKPDLAVLNTGEGTISILLGKGDGSFQAANTFAGDTNSYFIGSADLNADQCLDLVFTGDSGISVLLGKGDGTLAPPQHLDGGGSPGHVVVADFNLDGKPDLVVTNANGFGILLGNGDGTFQTRVDYGIGSGAGNGTAVAADFNGDNRLDLAVGSSTGIAILLGNGDGTFQAPVVQAGFANVRSAVDFDNDGKLDLLADNGFKVCGSYPHFSLCPEALGIIPGNGDGTFKAPSNLGIAVTFTAVAADFDGDGNADIGTLDGSDMLVRSGNGKGSFAPPVAFPLRRTADPGLIVGATVADLTGNKAPDIVGTNAGDKYAGVLLNNTGSEFSIKASEVSPGTIGQGQSATSTLTLTLLNKFEFPVSLACSVQPAKAGSPGCSFDSASVTFDSSGKAIAQLTIAAGTVTASRGPFSTSPGSTPWNWAWLPLAGLVFAGSGIRRAVSGQRRSLGFLVGSLLIIGSIAQTACGGGGGISGPKSNAYNITVTATSGATEHSTTVTLTVQ